MRALITGANGQLGRELVALLPDARCADRAVADVTDEGRLRNVIGAQPTDVVFHCAAFTDVDGCERDPVMAQRVNALGAANVARICSAHGIHLVALSTDYVFDGAGGIPNHEETTPHPLSVYGRTKLEAELAVRSLCPSHAVVRTSWLYGCGPRNFVQTVLRRAAAGEPLGMVKHEVSNPTWTADLAAALLRLARLRATGTFHLTNSGPASRLEWARAVLDLAGFDSQLVRPVSSYPLLARRPAYSALQNTRAAALGITLRPWREALADFLRSDPGVQPLSRVAVRHETTHPDTAGAGVRRRNTNA